MSVNTCSAYFFSIINHLLLHIFFCAPFSNHWLLKTLLPNFSPSAESQEEMLAQMLNEQQQQMLQNQAREAQHRQMLISSTPAPRGGLTMGTPIGIVRREASTTATLSSLPVVTTTASRVAVRTPIAVQPIKQNSNPSILPSSASASASGSHQILASSLSKSFDQPSTSKASSGSGGNESMSDHISRIISENEVILQGDPVSADFN